MVQDAGYHAFADRRAFAGIPHFWNVVSNGGFLVVGVYGIWAWRKAPWLAGADRWAWLVVVIASFGIGLGSGYYHWTPDNSSLFWDRLPMTLAFMGLFAAVIAEFIDARAGWMLLAPFVVLGALSVEVWRQGNLTGVGDLRFYALVQFYPMVAIPLIVWLFRSRYTHGWMYWGVLGWYVLAKGFEAGDAWLYESIGIGGHALKHAAAAVALWTAMRMIAVRHEL